MSTGPIRCHYEVLGVPRDADATALKKAYRQLIIKYHPDKNRELDQDLATAKFQEIQEAYDVLTDPKRREWYDTHRSAILRGARDGQCELKDLNILNPEAYMTSSVFDSYEASEPNNFYSVYQTVFRTIVAEENDLNDEANAPLFDAPTHVGKTPDGQDMDWADIVDFYDFWLSFSTTMSFAWCDMYNLEEAPNRRYRREAEKFNKKARAAGRSEYNDMVQRLAAYVRKKDPRVREYERLKEEEAAAEAARKAERAAKLEADKKRRRAELIQQYEEELARLEEEYSDWGEGEYDDEDADVAAGLWSSSSGGDEEEDEFEDNYCHVCSRPFKTANALSNHENSKKHKELAAKLRRQLESQEAELLGGGSGCSSTKGSKKKGGKKGRNNNKAGAGANTSENSLNDSNSNSNSNSKKNNTTNNVAGVAGDDADDAEAAGSPPPYEELGDSEDELRDGDDGGDAGDNPLDVIDGIDGLEDLDALDDIDFDELSEGALEALENNLAALGGGGPAATSSSGGAGGGYGGGGGGGGGGGKKNKKKKKKRNVNNLYDLLFNEIGDSGEVEATEHVAAEEYDDDEDVQGQPDDESANNGGDDAGGAGDANVNTNINGLDEDNEGGDGSGDGQTEVGGSDNASDASGSQPAEPSRPLTKAEKRKARKQKKAEKKAAKAAAGPTAGAANPDLVCRVCGHEFPSRNSLFKHVKKTGHALAT